MTNWSKILNISVALMLMASVTVVSTMAQTDQTIKPIHKIYYAPANLSIKTIDSKYGKIYVDNVTFDRLGKDEIVSKYQTEVLSIKNQKNSSLTNLPTPAEIATITKNYNTLNQLSAAISPLTTNYQSVNSEARTKVIKRESYSSATIYILYGDVQLHNIEAPPAGVNWDTSTCLEEREIYLPNDQAAEFIITYYSANRMASVSCNYCPIIPKYGGDTGYFGLPNRGNPVDPTHSYTYEFYIDSNKKEYDFWWIDDYTGQTWLNVVYPQSAPYYAPQFDNTLTYWTGSAEFHNWWDLNTHFLAYSTFTDYYVRTTQGGLAYAGIVMTPDNPNKIPLTCVNSTTYLDPIYHNTIISALSIGSNPSP